jgi:predicted PurR-regulated permease PerM
LEPTQLAHSAVAALRGWISSDKVFVAAVWSFSVLFGLILTGVLLAYFMLDTQRVAQGLLWLVPPGRRPFVRRLCTELNPILRRYFIGIAVVVTYAATAAYIGLGLILHLHHAGFLALLTGILELAPIVGPGLSALIGGLVAIQEATSVWHVLGYVVYAIALRISIDQVFGPLVLGRAAHVQPPLVIFCFLAGGVLLGVTGIILALPVALVVKSALAIHYADSA